MNKTLHKITKAQSLDFFLNFSGISLIGLILNTDARLKKTGNPYGKVWKKTRLLGNIGFHYYNSLNNQAKREEKEIDFSKLIKPRKWGKRIENTPLVEHKDNYYLEIKVEKTFEVNYFLENNAPILKSAIEQFLPKRKESSTQDQLDKKIILRDVAIKSIQSFTIGGKDYLVE